MVENHKNKLNYFLKSKNVFNDNQISLIAKNFKLINLNSETYNYSLLECHLSDSLV